SARNRVNAGVVQRRRRCWPGPKSLKINKGFNAGVAGSALQNRGLQVRFLPGLLRLSVSTAGPPPNKRLKLAGADRLNGSGALCPGGHGLSSATLAPAGESSAA